MSAWHSLQAFGVPSEMLDPDECCRMVPPLGRNRLVGGSFCAKDGSASPFLWLDALLRTLGRSKDMRKQREASCSVSLTCFGGVSSELPFRALQVLGDHGIAPDRYVLSPHSVSLFVPMESREAAVKALHSLVQLT